MKKIYAVLDIGSTTLKLLVAELMSTNINILFTKKLASHAIEGGLIKNEEVLVDEIRLIIKEADDELNTTITSVALVLPSNYARTYESKGITKVNSPQDKIEISDVVRALKIAQRFEKSKKEEIVSTIPVKYRLDTKEVDRIPLGLRSASLKVETLVITTSKKVLYSYLTAVEKAGLDVIDITIDAYASAKEAFDAAYLQEGAVMINIGHDHSTISFFEEGYLKYLKTIPMGGYTLTAAIADAWQISMEQAEIYKVKYGTCENDLGEEDVIHTTIVDGVEKNYTQKDLAEVLQTAVWEMMAQIKNCLEAINDGRTYETVVVGGGGELPCLNLIATDVLGTPVRCYRPETVGARDMSLVPCLGMLYCLDDRKELIGDDQVSLVLPDLSSTMSLKVRGLTMAKTETTHHQGKFRKFFDSIFNDD